MWQHPLICRRDVPIDPVYVAAMKEEPGMNHLLVVDDDTELCAMLQEYLTGEGFLVDLAHDGDSGAADGAGRCV